MFISKSRREDCIERFLTKLGYIYFNKVDGKSRKLASITQIKAIESIKQLGIKCVSVSENVSGHLKFMISLNRPP